IKLPNKHGNTPLDLAQMLPTTEQPIIERLEAALTEQTFKTSFPLTNHHKFLRRADAHYINPALSNHFPRSKQCTPASDIESSNLAGPRSPL
ncbi:MAG TPA: hypothetical protein VHD33_01105, partial [Legionellaceae bacterium]|nr:hypothetical protein [Legionellaceae bacterium]